MSAVTLPQPPIVRHEADNARKLEALEQFIELGQGSFYFALAQFDLPSLQVEVLGKLRERFSDLNLVAVELGPPSPRTPRTYNVLDKLRDLVKRKSPHQLPDALIITGYESLFPVAIEADDGLITDELVRAVQPLNLGRNLFAEAFPCPVLLCLPPTAMSVFLRSAPDLVSWRSGFFKFESDLVFVRAKLEQAAKASINRWAQTRWQLQRRKQKKLSDEAERLATLIGDAEAMLSPSLPNADRLIARLYQRLGGLAVALKRSQQAHEAFGKMLHRAIAADDQRLINAARRGQRAAKVITPAKRPASKQSITAQEVFHGAVALSEGEVLYGREDELQALIKLVTPISARFMTVWGETGCGKTSLVRAGLRPELERQGHYLTVIVDRWNEPETAIRHALAEASGLKLDSGKTLHECINHIAEQKHKIVVIICDQFERFFAAHPQRSARQPLIKAIGACLNDYGIAFKFIFVLREDLLWRMVEFETEVPEAIEQRKRFYVPSLSFADAVSVLQTQADNAELDWSPNFVRTVVADLTVEDRVSPIKLQLVGAALVISGINDEIDYAQADRAEGLIKNYLDNVLAAVVEKEGLQQRTTHQASCDHMKHILLTLMDDQAKRLSFTASEIARRIGLELQVVEQYLGLLTQIHLVQEAGVRLNPNRTIAESDLRYELVHDAIADLIPHNLREKRRKASLVLERAISNLSKGRYYTIALDEWELLKTFGDQTVLANPRLNFLLRRSHLWGIYKKNKTKLAFALVVLLIIINLLYVATPLTTKGQVYTIFGFKEKRRGLFISTLNDVRNKEWIAAARVVSEAAQGDAALTSQALTPLLAALTYDDDRIQKEAASTLIKIITGDRVVASRVLESLLNALKDGEGKVRMLAVDILLRVVFADSALASHILPPLLEALKDDNDGVRARAAEAVKRIVSTHQGLADQAFQPLLSASKDGDEQVRQNVALALGAVAQANHTLINQILQTLLVMVTDSDDTVRSSAAKMLGEISRTAPHLATKTFQHLLVTLTDGDYEVRKAAVQALGSIAQVDYSLGHKIFPFLITSLKDREISVRDAAMSSSAKFLFNLAIAEATNNCDPLQFLFAYVKGRHALLTIKNADISLQYRDVVSVVLARWLVSNRPETKPTKQALSQLLKQMHSSENEKERGMADKVFNEIKSLERGG
jgi:HEAT repeat protein